MEEEDIAGMSLPSRMKALKGLPESSDYLDSEPQDESLHEEDDRQNSLQHRHDQLEELSTNPASWLQNDSNPHVVSSLNFTFNPATSPQALQSQSLEQDQSLPVHPLQPSHLLSLSPLPASEKGGGTTEDEKTSRKRKNRDEKKDEKKKKRYTCSKCHGWLVGDVCPGKPCNGGPKCKAPWKHPNGYQQQLSKWVAAAPDYRGSYLTEDGKKLKEGEGTTSEGGTNGNGSGEKEAAKEGDNLINADGNSVLEEGGASEVVGGGGGEYSSHDLQGAIANGDAFVGV